MNPHYPRPRIRCAKFGWNWHSGSYEEDENVKRLQRERRTDNRRQVTRKADLPTFQYNKLVYIQIEFIKFVSFSWRLISWIISFKSSSGSSFVSDAKIIFCESLQKSPWTCWELNVPFFWWKNYIPVLVPCSSYFLWCLHWGVFMACVFSLFKHLTHKVFNFFGESFTDPFPFQSPAFH